MTEPRKRFGLSVALATPLTAGGAIDFKRMANHARWCLDNGCDSVTLFGTTGEGASIGLAGRNQAFGAMLGAGLDARTQMLAGVAAASVHEALEQARAAYDVNCRGTLVAPPFYFKGVSDEGLHHWYAKLFDALGARARDVILYHIPSVTAVDISPNLISMLRKSHPGVVIGVKDSSGDQANTQKLLDTHADLAILVGDERQLAETVRKGGQGTICGVANFLPHLLRPMAHEGRSEPRIDAVVDALCAYPVIPAVKAMVGHVHRDPAWLTVRPPLDPLPAADAAALGAAVDRIVGAKAA
ncbi:dihydrodipicolinate synthase family protein [Alsobacter sp. R-9]